MTDLFQYVYSLSANDLYTPFGLAIMFLLAFAGEFRVGVPFYMDAVYLSAGVGLASGSLMGLVLFPLNMAGAALGACVCLWVLIRGFAWAGRFLSVGQPGRFAGLLGWRRRASPSTMHLLERLMDASPVVIALVRELPGMQLPLTVAWAAGRGRRNTLAIGVALSVALHAASLMAIGAISGRILYDRPVAAFFWSMGAAMLLGLILLGVGRLVHHRFRPKTQASYNDSHREHED